VANVAALETCGILGFVPDAHLTGELKRLRGPLKCAGDSPEHVRMRARSRGPAGQARYRRRQALVEPVIGVLKEQRGLRRFRRRGLKKVAVEPALACTAFNLTRMWRPPGLEAGTPLLGVVTSTLNNPREIQFALRFNF
jgi:hypothetical protein